MKTSRIRCLEDWGTSHCELGMGKTVQAYGLFFVFEGIETNSGFSDISQPRQLHTITGRLCRLQTSAPPLGSPRQEPSLCQHASLDRRHGPTFSVNECLEFIDANGSLARPTHKSQDSSRSLQSREEVLSHKRGPCCRQINYLEELFWHQGVMPWSVYFLDLTFRFCFASFIGRSPMSAALHASCKRPLIAVT